ncbi:MAG: hypothetical protein KF774_12485 [Planctomyces sp.]|nr:hypothetical protein [Planctomyces sp.]
MVSFRRLTALFFCIVLAQAAAIATAASPPCPYSKYPMGGDLCTWFCMNCDGTSIMVQLPCSHPYGSCSTYANCIGPDLKSDGSTPPILVDEYVLKDGTPAYLPRIYREGYTGRLFQRLDDPKSDFPKPEGLPVTTTVEDSKDLLVAVDWGGIPAYLYVQAILLKIELPQAVAAERNAPQQSESLYWWVLLETRGTDGAPPTTLEHVEADSVAGAPGLYGIELEVPALGKSKLFPMLRHKRVAAADGVGVLLDEENEASQETALWASPGRCVPACSGSVRRATRAVRISRRAACRR